MSPASPDAPVVVGVGFGRAPSDDPLACPEPYRLMVEAVRDAAADAGSPDVLRHVQSVSVPRGMWQYRNPGKLVADALGLSGVRSVVADLGVLQLTPLFELFRAVAAGEQSMGLVTGGEAQYRELRSMITGRPVSDTVEPEGTPPPDVHHTSQDPFCSDLEAQRGLHVPVEHFAIIESALRHDRGLGVEEHRDRLARLYGGFSEVAARNPRAWRREPVAPEEIRDPTARNAMLAFPYTKRHCSNWNVNQAVAILVCARSKARALGLAPERWIHPLAGVESRHVVVLAQQRRLGSRPGTVLCGERALALAGVAAGDVTAAELYSCFPAAIQSFARDLGLEGVCPLTVTGSMAFAGGPFNSFSLEGVARMAEVLRAAATPPRRIGLVSNLSGIFGKQACAVLSNVAPERGFAWEDVTAEVAARDVPLPLVTDYAGPATIAGYTVAFVRHAPSHAIAVCDTPRGERTVARTDDVALAGRMTREEFVGRRVEVGRDGSFGAADRPRG
jgi:acetyl-CoA C-acetyltransferase